MRVLFWVCILSSVCVTSALANCSCSPETKSAEELYNEVDIIAIGQVIQARRLNDQGQTAFLIQPHQVLKGNIDVERANFVVHPQSMSSSCRSILIHRKNYLLGVVKVDDRYVIRSCHLSRPLAGAKPLLDELAVLGLIQATDYQTYLTDEFLNPYITPYMFADDPIKYQFQTPYAGESRTFSWFVSEEYYKELWQRVPQIRWRTPETDIRRWFGDPVFIMDGASHNERLKKYIEMQRNDSVAVREAADYQMYYRLNYLPRAVGNARIVAYRFTSHESNGAGSFTLIVYLDQKGEVMLWKTLHNFETIMREFEI